MPIYEYVCEACGRLTEALQRVSDPPLATCPHCGGALRKRVSAPAFQFKGSGWYVTDYAQKGEGRKKDAGEASSASKTETADKPAAATPDKGSTSEKAAAPSKPGGDRKD